MGRKVLKNKPLVEAIFEVRWKPQESAQEIEYPYYKILIGRIYDRIKDEYPYHEQLPTATIPDQIAGYIVQHRFRKGKDKWPLVQIGPGIVTLNDTEKYVWEDFEKRIHQILDVLFEVYQDAENSLNINGLLLRYIDGVDFNYEEDNVLSFLDKNLKIKIDIYKKLFEETGVDSLPLGFNLMFSFPAAKPKGAVQLKFVRGKRKNTDALIWETHIQSIDNDVPKDREHINTWITDAHTLTDNWFFKMIKGELLERFE